MHYGSDQARALHAECPPIDLHADPLLWSRFVGYDLNKKHKPPLPNAHFGGHTDVPRMQEGGIGAQVFGLVSLPYLDWNLEKVVHRQITALHDAAAKSEGALRVVTTAEAFAQASRDKVIGGLLAIEGAHALRGDLEALTRFFERGVRSLGLLHFSANECGSPCGGKGAERDAPLTHFGHAVVERCEELGVVVDLAHINRRGFLDVCAASKKPLVVSHTGIAGVHPIWRNIDDDQLRAVAKKQGVIGVIFCPYYLGKDGLDGVVDHLLYVMKVAGEDAPALGSDWDGFIRPTKGLEEASKLPQLTDALLARGVSKRAIEKMLRTNALRVFEAGLP